ncbi:gamma-glutamyltranspeptidase [Lasiosphaeria ovina]|uniref:Gamma-glutamyltranspeptidase n=1 Tax=Lasiosphaeria ovina TaxID=92902 RepID=A0AAE0N0M4_9PEZI|nr:gamma-glutamyltranspeptidase [Lasiosphaeria ovina]
MTEPCSTGIGGDMFCLYYDAATGSVSALNGSGRAGAACTLDTVRRSLGVPDGVVGKIPMSSVHAVTVPGAAAGWADTVDRLGSGRLSLAQILAPAIELGETGFPVSELTAYFWQRGEASIRRASPNFAEMLKDDPAALDGVRAPRAGEIIRLPQLAQTFRALAAEGKRGFYTGRVAAELVKVCGDLGGHLTLADLQHHLDTGSEAVAPISLKFCGQKQQQQQQQQNDKSGVELWEHPPNGQGIVALMALGILEELEARGAIATFGPADHNSAPYLHAVVEALRIAFADASWFVTDADPAVGPGVPTAELVSRAYLAARARLFDATRASDILRHGDPLSSEPGSPALSSSDTVYFCVADAAGNAISFINSNYGGFGTAIIPAGCGFTLQNRGANFSLRADHPNVLAPRKRPYHTIIPGLVTNLGGTKPGSLHSVFGVMGGFMQPQGHVQVLLGQLVGGLSPQQALDAPRVCIGAGMPEDGGDGDGDDDEYDRTVYVEEGMPAATVDGLRALGHRVQVVTGHGRALFGRGQIIRRTRDGVTGVSLWSAGSDMRGDGAAYPA